MPTTLVVVAYRPRQSSQVPERHSEFIDDGCDEHCDGYSAYPLPDSPLVANEAEYSKVRRCCTRDSRILADPWDRKIQLAVVFSVGIFVIGVTTARLPLIFEKSNQQATRSMVRIIRFPSPRQKHADWVIVGVH